MPNLDVSELLSDPDFVELATVYRTTVLVNTLGRGVPQVQSFQITAAIVNLSGAEIDRRGGDSERDTGRIRLWTQTPLILGAPDQTADIVVWHGRSHTITNIRDFTDFGAGFIEAEARQIAMSETPDPVS